MHRWRTAGLGPRLSLVAGALLGLLSLSLHEVALAGQAKGYPGPPAGYNITPGPPLGCTPIGATNQTWAHGFNALSTVTFKVDGRLAGASEADSNGEVLIVISFLPGHVQVNDNSPVRDRRGVNYLIAEGKRDDRGVERTVGLRFKFETPTGTRNVCVTKPVVPPPTLPPTTLPPTVTTLPRRPHHRPPVETTLHGFYPTTLAEVLRRPLAISPNRVIEETSLLAAVLAAALCAGALGTLFTGGDGLAPAGTSGSAGGAGPSSGSTEVPAAPSAPVPPASPPQAAPTPPPAAETPPPPPPKPPPRPERAGGATNAFVRRRPEGGPA